MQHTVLAFFEEIFSLKREDMSQNIISVKHISKEYRINKRSKGLFGHLVNLFYPKYEMKRAVDDISFDISEGEIVGFIGANGAGKSTTIKMLTGILYPTSGEIQVANMNPYKERKKYVRDIGVVFGQKSQLSWDLPIIDSYELLKKIYNIPDEVYESNLKLYVDLLDMSGFINQPVRQLSLGQRMRADIVAALLHSPRIIFFDEPTIGLDVLAKEKIRNFIKYLKDECNITMIFTTHDMSDIEKTCDRIIIIDDGHKVYDDSVKKMLELYGNKRKLIIELSSMQIPFEINKEYRDIMVSDNEGEENEIIIEFDNGMIRIDTLIKEIVNKYDVRNIKIEEVGIERIVREIYSGSIVL